MYRFNRRKIFFYSLVSAVSMFAMAKYDLAILNKNENFDFLHTSLVSILENVAEKRAAKPPDLGIERVTLRKTSDPTDSFNYYTYSANIILKNHGGDLKNAQLSMHAGDDQKHLFVKNEIDGFSLAKGQNYIVDNYEIYFDGNYNGGKVTVEIRLPEGLDYYAGNNKYDVEIFEAPPKIEALGLEKINDEGEFVLEFQPANSAIPVNGFEAYTAERPGVSEVEEKYAETQMGTESGQKIYSYSRIKNSPEILRSPGWKLKSISNSDGYSLKFQDDPFADPDVHYVYLKSTDTETGNYAISNLIKLSPQKELDRAAFAKLFVDYADIDVFDTGENYFDDVSPQAWYSSYVQTIYNLGLIKNDSYRYNPDLPMTRGDVLRVVLDYFDVDLAMAYGGPHFADISSDHYLFPYAEALFSGGKGGVLGENFHPDKTATKNYLKYLINEYKENS